MNYQTKLAALLLASASIMGMGQARAADPQAILLADTSGGAAVESVEMSVTGAADDQGGGTTSSVGTIDVQGIGTALGNGYIVPEDGPKARSTVTHAGIENLLPSANPYQMIGQLPGVTQFQDDAVGLSGGTLRVRGLFSSQLGVTINGAPVNDSGNFAVYPQEYVDAENLDQVWVTQGSTDIDAPHVGASGGNVGIVTRAPMDNFNVRVDGGFGADSYAREFVSVDTGWIGDFKGFVSFSHAYVDKWRGGGNDDRYHTDGNLLWQFLPHSSIGAIWTYNTAVDYFYDTYYGGTIFGDTALQAFETIGSRYDYDTFWGTSSAPINLFGSGSGSCTGATPAVTPKCTVLTPAPYSAVGTTTVTNYWGLHVNPFKDGVFTVPLHVQLTDDLRWDTNGYLWVGYGGGSTGTTLTVGQGYNGYIVPSLYGAPKGDAILLYRSSVTRTFRPGFTSKLVWDVDNFSFMAGVWAEHAEHRQTAPFSLVNPNGQACDQWLLDYNSCWLGGSSLIQSSHPTEYRDFKTVSVGQAVYGEAQGRFLDDALKVNVGVTYRDIHRSMYDYLPVCADNPNLTQQYAGSTSAALVNCSTYATSAAFLTSSTFTYFGGTPGMTAGQQEAVYAKMAAFAANPHANWGMALPEFSATYDIDPDNQVFADTMSGFRTPSNFNFSSFNSTSTPTYLELTDIKSEVAHVYEVGYRFHGDMVTTSTTVFLNDVKDYQATANIDNNPADDETANIGGVRIYGIEFEAGTKPWNGFTFYGALTLEKSELENNLQAGQCGLAGSPACGALPTGTTLYLPTAGKQLVDTPEWILSTTIGYEHNGFIASLSPHCQGARATSLMNDEFVSAFCDVDASVGYKFDQVWGPMQGAKLQLFVTNMLDVKQLGEITSQAQISNFATASIQGPVVPANSSYSADPYPPLFIGLKLSVDVQ